jgi:hypothetical protein
VTSSEIPQPETSAHSQEHSDRRGLLIRRWALLGVSRFSEIQFLVLLLVLFVTSPFVEGLPRGQTIEAALLSMALLSAVVAVGGRRTTLIVAILLVTPAAVGRWVHHHHPDVMPVAGYLVPAILFAGFVVWHHLWFILKAPEVDSRVLCAGMSTYLMLGLLWSLVYLLIASVDPGAFAITVEPDGKRTMTGFTAFYFSFVTLCTTGYGDIAPVARVARMAAVMESIAGTFYMAILISRLVSLHTARGLRN